MEEPVRQPTLEIGDTLLNEYYIESVLGNPGGFGITYLATDINLQRKVAIKQYLPGELATREGVKTDREKEKSSKKSPKTGVECFKEEAQRLAQFNHPNIVRILRFFEHNNGAYLVMEYQEGLSLTEHLQQHGPLNQEELLNMVLPLLDALKHIHDAQYLHRDIKPNNIYIRTDKSPVLLDFGSARQALAKRSRSITTIVSPGYAPLEQYDDVASEQGPWTDIYALGGVMYYAISGETPPAATRRVNKDPMTPAITMGAGHYSKSILTAIDWALEPSDDKRPRSIEKWRDQLLMDIEPTHPAHHQTSAFTTRQTSSLSERSATIILPGLVVILLVIATAVSLYQLNQTTQELNGLRQTLESSQAEQQKAVNGSREQQQQIEKLQKDVHAEQQKSVSLELLLGQERKQRSEVEETRRKMEDALDRLRHFEPQAVEDAFQGKLPKSQITYYKVVGVQENDKLKVREFAAHVYKQIGEIPATATCVRYLRKLETLKNNQPWAFIEYSDAQKCVRGWVNTTYLKEITDPDNHKHCDEQLSTLVPAQPCPDEESDSNQSNH